VHPGFRREDIYKPEEEEEGGAGEEEEEEEEQVTLNRLILSVQHNVKV